MRIFAILALLFSATTAHAQNLQTAIFAGGCFWCVESDFDKVEGVVETISGYTGGTLENPTYKQVTKGGTGHYEAVQITFDADVVSYDQLLYVFWRTVDPTDAGGQFCDRGSSYRTAIFALDNAQTAAANASKSALPLADPIVTPILPASTFYPAEDYHQNYHNTNSLSYKFYRSRCGRDARVRQIWGDDAIFAS